MTDKEKLKDILDEADIGCYESKYAIVTDAYDDEGNRIGVIIYSFGSSGILINIRIRKQ